MRHTINIKASPNVKGQNIHIENNKLIKIQQNQIIKIQQNKRTIYGICISKNENTTNLNNIKAQLSKQYMISNNFIQDLSSISKMNILLKIKQIQIQLSDIDWQIVNNKIHLFQTTFLDQVRILWPSAIIPLFYDQNNFITLYPNIDKLCLVDSYAAISFTLKTQLNNTNSKNQQNNQNDQQFFQGIQMILNHVYKQKTIDFGYDNIIYVSKKIVSQLYKYRSKKCGQLWCMIEPCISFITWPSLTDFNSQKSTQLSKPHPTLVKIVASPKMNQNLNQFQCTQICKEICLLPDQIAISYGGLNSFDINISMSFQMFIKELKEDKIQIRVQRFGNAKDQQAFKEQFAGKLIQAMLSNQQFVFLQNYYPFIINDQIIGLELITLGKNNLSSKNFILIKNTLQPIDENENIQDQQSKDEYKRILKQHIKIYPSSQSSDLYKWTSLIKKFNQKNRPISLSFQEIFEKTYKSQIQQIIQFLNNCNKNDQFNSLLVTTYSSNGKSFLHQLLQTNIQCNARSWMLQMRTLNQQANKFQDIKQYLQTFISICPYKIIFFDNIDSFLPNIEKGDQMRQKQKSISNVFAKLLINLLQSHSKIGIFTSKSQSSINPLIKFDKIVKLKNPSRQIRQQLLNTFLSQDNQLRQQLLSKTQSLSLGAFYHYLSSKTIPKKCNNSTTSMNNFNKIVGLNQAKQIIKSVIEKPNKFGFIYDKVKIKVPRGILLYGATGNGKTALANSVQQQFNMKFFSVKGSDILSKYIGGSQAAVRDVFQRALAVSPAIIFFDQFQSIVPRRNSSGTGVTDRVVNQFLCYLDGVSSTTGVFIICASSRPDLIDPALLRPGRIDSHIYLQYPNEQQRRQLIKMFSNSVKINVQEDQIVKASKNYSYSDLIGLLKQLRIKQSSHVLKHQSHPTVQQLKTIPSQLFYQTISSFRIGTNAKQKQKQTQLFTRFKEGKGQEVDRQKQIQM